MTTLETMRTPIVAKRAARVWRGRVGRLPIALLVALLVTAATSGCYPRYDWREFRPDCARGWCGFVASFPGKPTSATREIPVGTTRAPLTAHIVSVGDVSFALLSFDLGSGASASDARAVLQKKLLADVGAQDGRRAPVTVRAADRSAIAADQFEVDGTQGGKVLHCTARFVERDGRLIEALVIGPADALAKDSGRQAVETFFTSLRLD